MSIRPTAVTNDSAHHAHDAHPLGSPAYHEQRLKEVLAAGHAHNEATTGAPAKSSVQKLMSGGMVSATFNIKDSEDVYDSARNVIAMTFVVDEKKKPESTEHKFDPRYISDKKKADAEMMLKVRRAAFGLTSPYKLEKKHGQLVLCVDFTFMDTKTNQAGQEGYAYTVIASKDSEMGNVEFITDDGASMSGTDEEPIRRAFDALRQHIQRMTGMAWYRKSRYDYYYNRIFNMNN